MSNSEQRQHQLRSLEKPHDVLVIGGGINGAVSAAALSATGASVALVDRLDFAGFTSQESSNLVWGGFKYLQTYEFALVRKLCRARNRLVDAYPSMIEPIDFLAVFDENAPFPRPLAVMGSYAYWAIGSFATRRPRPMRTSDIAAAEPVVDVSSVKGGLRYADAYLRDNDARFVFGFIRQAQQRGATVANYVEVTAADWDGHQWRVALRDVPSGATLEMTTRSIVNAAGPFIDTINTMLGVETDHKIALSKGIHLIVPHFGSGDRVLAFFDEDERLYYVIPMGERTCIGTTDTKVTDPDTHATDDDIEFLLRQINRRLTDAVDLTKDDVIATRSGVRPLAVTASSGDDTNDEPIDWLELSRNHQIELDADKRVVSIFGGKLTDCLNVGEEIVDELHSCNIVDVGAADLPTWFGEPAAEAREAIPTFAASAWLAISAASIIKRKISSTSFDEPDGII